MANRLTMAEVDTILTLHRSGCSNREIARLTGVHRETVGRYVAQAAAENRPLAPPGSAAEPGESVTGPPGGKSACRELHDVIVAKLDQGLSARRIHQDLVAEQGLSASYWSVRRYAAKLGAITPLPFRRIETPPGEEAQVDFGTGAWVLAADGKRRRPWVFRIVLSYSRKAYSEAVWRQTTDDFIACLENAFHFFGGAVGRLVIDNLKAAVPRADWYDPDVHPKLRAFAAHYGTAILPTKPYMPRHKGKVESSVKYVKNNGLKGRTFESLAQQNAFLGDWERSVADQRIHGTTKQQVAALFAVERGRLLPLPADRFPCYREAQRAVHRDGHVEVAGAFYSAPPEYVGSRVWVRWDGRLVRLYNGQFEQIALHATAEPGRFRTSAQHIPREKVSAVERGTDALLRQVASIGPETRQWAEAMTAIRGVEGVRVLVGLKALAGKHATEDLERACRIALSHGAYRLRAVRELLKRRSRPQGAFEFLADHPIIRPLSDYSLAALHEFRKERTP
jgi:transposase